jgi:hypothetical protein
MSDFNLALDQPHVFAFVPLASMNLRNTTLSSKALAHASVVAISVVSVTTAPRGA